MIKTDSLKKKLLLKGLPEGYADRLLTELSEHEDDIVREKMERGHSPEEAKKEAAEILGGGKTIINAACRGMREDTFIGRHTPVAFILLPVILLAATLISVLGIGKICGGLLDVEAPPYKALFVSGLFFLRYGATVMIAAAFCFLSKRYYIPVAWSAVPCFLMALPGVFFFDIYPPAAGAGSGLVTVGLPFSARGGALSYFAAFTGIRFCLPILVFAAFVFLRRRSAVYAK